MDVTDEQIKEKEDLFLAQVAAFKITFKGIPTPPKIPTNDNY